MTDSERFEAIRARYVAAQQKRDEYRYGVLLRKYGRVNPPAAWLTRGEATQLERQDRAIERASDQMMELLDRVGGRCWRSPAPWRWVMGELSWSDATTRGELSCVPPAAYGFSRRDMEVFAAAA